MKSIGQYLMRFTTATKHNHEDNVDIKCLTQFIKNDKSISFQGRKVTELINEVEWKYPWSKS